MSHDNFWFEHSSKRRKGFPSERRVKKGLRVVHGAKELIREAGPQRSMPVRLVARIQEMLHAVGFVRRV